MNRLPLRRVGFAVAVALLLLGAVSLVARGDRVLGRLGAAAGRAEERLGARLRDAGVLAYWDFDGLRVVERIGRSAGLNRGTRVVDGRAGSARAFPAGGHGLIRTGVPVAALGERFTFSGWLRLPPVPPDQQIFQYLAVRAGRIVLRLPGQDDLVGPAPPADAFFHVAATVDGPAGHARLYVGGVRVGQLALRPLLHAPGVLAFGQEAVSPPPAFTLDEFSLWASPLDDARLGRLARMRRPLDADVALPALLRLRAAEAALASWRSLMLAVDLFDPSLHESRVHAAGLRSYALAMSRSDVREFNRYFNEQLENGLTGPGSSRKRRVEVLEGGRQRTAVMELLAAEAGDPAGSEKRTFTLDILTDDGESERKVLIRPIEGAPYLIEVLAGELARRSGLPAAAPELCTVAVNGTFEGIHLCSDLVRDQGPYWLGVPGAWQALLRRAPFFRDEVLREFDRLAASVERALRSDRKSALSSGEIRGELRRQRRLLERELPDAAARSDAALVARVAEHVREDLFVGDNPHPTLVVGDLALPPRTINGAELSFVSLTPGVLGSDGRVTPPAREEAGAVLRVTVRSGAASRDKDLPFVVLPARRRLPILKVQSAGEPPAGEPVASLVEVVDGANRRSPLLEGRVRLRGNTSLARRRNQKKYYRVALDQPFDAPGVGRTRVLFLTSGWRDVTLMRERIAYDLFREFSAPGAPRYAPHVQPVELVVNGDYKGVYNLTDRVDADLLEFGKSSGGPGGAVLYKAMDELANFWTPVRGAYVQKVPDWRDGERWAPFDELITFVGASTPEVFRDGVERVLDVGSVADFEILLKFTGNFEGKNTNLFLARRGGADARFFIVPWDYDMTFHDAAIPSNFLIERLHRDLPGYGPRVLARWRSLRAGPLAEPALASRIDALQAELADAAARNYRRWPNTPGETWQGETARLRAFIAEHLGRLDAHFAALGGSR